LTAVVTPESAPAPRAAGGLGGVARFFDRHPRLRLWSFLSGPMLWLVVAYIGSLILMLSTSLHPIDDFTSEPITSRWTLSNFRQLVDLSGPYPTKILRTIGIAAAVTVIDMVLAVPLAFFFVKVLRPRWRRIAVVAVLMPLWASYIVKVYAWRTLLNPEGGVLAKSVRASPGFSLASLVLVLAYLWLPYMILPVMSGLERLPDSLLEASADLGGRAGRTLRSVVVPLLVPSIAAGSIFTFSLSLGDYISVKIVGGTTDVIGSTVERQLSTNLPFAAALAVGSIAVMGCYLTGVRRLGAFDSL
jgi:putative spermidine/putrescine transport system permease protein